MSKAVAGILAIGVGAGATTFVVFTSEAGMPEWENLSSLSSSYNDKYPASYLRFLVKAEDNETKSDKWWEWSYKKRYKKEGSTDGFQNLSDWKALKAACKKAYGGTKGTNEITVNGNGGGTTTKYKEDDFWKYCSPMRSKIKTITEAQEESNYTTPENAYGKDSKDKLASTKDNEGFWNFQQSEYDKQETSKKTLSKSSIKEWCGEAYKQTKPTEETSEYKEDNVFKWCSLKGQKDS